MGKWWEEPGRINWNDGRALYSGHWQTALGNIIPSVRDMMISIPEKVLVKDDTLREGEECPNHKPITIDTKIKLAKELVDAGIKETETGFPATLQSHWEFAQRLKDEVPEMKQSAHPRANKPENWKEAIDRSIDSGAEVLYMNFKITDELIRANLPFIRKDHLMEDLVDHCYEKVKYVKDRGVISRAGIGTPQRNPLDRVILCWKAFADAGTDRLHVSDGNGIVIPESMKYYMRLGKSVSPKSQLATHCHDDYGMANANIIAAVTAGCEVIDLSFNGMGDRGGLAATEIVVPNLEIQYGVDTGVKMERLYPISKLVEEMWGIPLEYQHAIVGRNMWVHEEGPHIRDVLLGREIKDGWKNQNIANPEVFGAKETIQFSPTSVHKGPESCLAVLISQLGYNYTDNQFDELVKRILEISDRKNFATEEEVTNIIKEIMIPK
jgi:isopropylmalate/homocitrate/citramalate synthase